MQHYDFEARIPLDHVMHLVTSFREGTLLVNRGDNLMCAGSAVGEVGALLKTFEVDPEPIGAINSVRQMTLGELIEEFEAAFPKDQDPATFQINPFLAVLIQRLIELLLDELLK